MSAELHIPDEAVVATLKAVGYRDINTVTPADAGSARDFLVEVAPLIVAAELRRWADLLSFKTGLTPDRAVVSGAIEMLRDQLRDRAAELEGGES